MSRTVVDHDDRLPDAGYICPQCFMVFLALPEDGGCDCEDEPVVAFHSVLLPEPTSFWAYVQLMGHIQIAGRVTYREDGTVLVDVPAFTNAMGEKREAFTRILYPGAIYAITPCTEEEATTAARIINAIRIPHWLLTEPGEDFDPDNLPF